MSIPINHNVIPFRSNMEGIESRPIVRVENKSIIRENDTVSVESPLSIKILDKNGLESSLGLLMRTPGEDSDLVRGLLYSEGIISSESDILEIQHHSEYNLVILSDEVSFNPEEHNRKLTMTSSCGICGKESISNLIHMHGPELSKNIFVNIEAISNAISSLQNGQNFFSSTGGTHACARIDNSGSLISIAEDIGRHNAMDKLIGNALKNDYLPVKNEIVVVSGRASFELVQKSLRAGFPIMVALGAPSSLAIDLALEHGMTLVGFAKKNKITIFSGSKRIV
ncbi:MAG: formate dehydrogenase family accessory protein FdhD [Euryarchaeota archaeon]|nr:formate dehydrogenase family accessory protein FdhD [Euryarchaeota archaeon]